MAEKSINEAIISPFIDFFGVWVFQSEPGVVTGYTYLMKTWRGF